MFEVCHAKRLPRQRLRSNGILSKWGSDLAICRESDSDTSKGRPVAREGRFHFSLRNDCGTSESSEH
jgi:hypothetical protein